MALIVLGSALKARLLHWLSCSLFFSLSLSSYHLATEHSWPVHQHTPLPRAFAHISAFVLPALLSSNSLCEYVLFRLIAAEP
jgi:hypothetical protein